MSENKETLSALTLGQFTPGNGSMDSVTVTESKSGQMVPATKVTGETERQTEKAAFITLMAMSTKATGWMTKQMETEHTPMQTKQST